MRNGLRVKAFWACARSVHAVGSNLSESAHSELLHKT
jgi:hypothetical protein